MANENTTTEAKTIEKAANAAAKASEVVAINTPTATIELQAGVDDRITIEGVGNYSMSGREPQTRMNLSVTNAEAKLQLQKIATAMNLELRANSHANGEFFVLVDLSVRAVQQLRREGARAVKLKFDAIVTGFLAGEMILELADNKAATPLEISRPTILTGGRIVKERAQRSMDDLGDLGNMPTMGRRRGAASARM